MYYKKRVLLVGILFSVVAAVIIVQLYALTILTPKSKLERFNQSSFSIRGNIYDRNERPLAVSYETATVGVNPPFIRLDPKHVNQEAIELVTFLSEQLQLPELTIIQKLKSQKSYEVLKRSVPKEVGQAIRNFNQPGLVVDTSYARGYLQNDTMAHVLGFVKRDGDGGAGIEYACNSLLKASPELSKLANGDINSLYGASLELTLDLILQTKVEDLIREHIQKTQAESASVVIADSSTGNILAMANYPTFDPNFYWESDPTLFSNPCIAHAYEVGSIFKIFAAAMLLDQDLVTETTETQCTGSIHVDDHIVHSIQPEGHGTLSFQDVIKYSSNVGIYKFIQRIKNATFYDYLNRFGFGKKTRIHRLEGENPGLMPSLTAITDHTKGMISIGYEIAVTPIQLVAAASALVNGGWLIRPNIIKEIRKEDGTIIWSASPDVTNIQPIISERTSQRIWKLMKRVIEPGGTGSIAYRKEIELAGKTGTAQIFDWENKKQYLEDEINASFLGFIPTPQTKLVCLVVLRKPVYGTSASQVAVPLFSAIVSELMQTGILYEY
jgi:cell division protein FtsI/penicillin-binding protein 2